MVELVGENVAGWLAFEVERDYWQRRNHAAQLQKARQDCMGFGWANHDHHTFRSSRSYFQTLLAVFHTFGFVDREQFYAGLEAGWGAQILEQPACNLVVFADVDLMPDEVEYDFAHKPLEPREKLGTVGLWCGLHGESMLRAGMHHLEAQFRFDELREELRAAGRQHDAAVQQPEVSSAGVHRRRALAGVGTRLDDLLDRRLIDQSQADHFRREGAIGSHLENLQRRHGFKGFNQKNVSDIITRTDPRRFGR